ncbi:MAG: dUTP diphosphatase [Psychrobacter sp.]|nr:dUTP diphosphatase [Psychrobacter sp.]
MSFKAEIKLLDPRIGVDPLFPLPSRSTPGSAGIDLRVCIDEPFVLKAGEQHTFNTGMAIYLKDPAYVGLALPRSGLGTKHGIVLGNLVGVIDAHYQGELGICLWNRSTEDYTIKVGERIAQYFVTAAFHPDFSFVTEFSDESERGEGGFGSSGTK